MAETYTLTDEVEDGQETPATPEPNKDVLALKEEILGLKGALGEIRDTFSAVVAETRRSQVPPTASPAIDEVSDDELDRAITTGEGAAKTLRRLVAAERERIRREDVDPLRNYGVGMFSNLTMRQIKGEMPHYERFKKDIDAQLAAMPPETRANPEAVKYIYNSVVGENMGVLIQDEVEKQLRQKADTTATTDAASGGRSRVNPKKDEPLNAEEVFGREAMQSLRAVNRDPEQFVKSLGYESMDEYLKLYAQLEENNG